jgi:outer membrane lipoprotein carrier protein
LTGLSMIIKVWIRTTFLLICLVSLCLLPFKAGGDEGLPEILEGILHRYGNLKGLSVTYQREIITKSMALLGEEMKGDLATGKIFFKPPHNLYIKQETPKPETVVTDGRTLWWYIPDKKLVYQYPSYKLGKELILLGDIFRGLRSIGDSFDVIQSDLGDKKEYHLRLIPNPPWEEIDHIDLRVSKESFEIRSVEVHNILGNITRFILGDLTLENDLDTGMFQFKVPAGVEVVKEK